MALTGAAAQPALAWVPSNPAISVALVGNRSPAELEENLAAADRAMTQRVCEELRAVVTS